MEFKIRSVFESAKQFLREVKTELKKVTWPTRKDTLAGTAIVLVTVCIAAVFLFIIDYGLSTLIKWFLRGAVG
jgi:preprotein translocase subunit SecE